MVDYSDLIGVPFEYGGRDESSFDCYGLLRHLYKKDGIDIPDYLSPSDGLKISALMLGELRLWEKTELFEGGALLFRLFGNMHVGYYIGNGKFIHTWERSGGVVIERMSDWKENLIGCYKYVGS